MTSPRELVERLEAVLTPSAVAVEEAGGESLTGSDLLEQIRITTRLLQSAGVRKGDLVLACRRSPHAASSFLQTRFQRCRSLVLQCGRAGTPACLSL